MLEVTINVNIKVNLSSSSSLLIYIYLIGKLHMHSLGLEPTASASIPLLWEEEVQLSYSSLVACLYF